MATIRFRRALLGNVTVFLWIGAISAESVEFSGEQRTDSPPGSNKFRMVYENAAGRISWRSNMLRAEIQRALRRAPRQLRRLARLANSPGFESFRCPRWRIKFSLERFQISRASACVSSRWKVLSGEFRRRPTALVKKFASRIVSVAEDCLSPERTFHG